MSIDEITPEISRRVQEMIANDFEDATDEDLELYREWKEAFEAQEAEFERQAEYNRQQNALQEAIYTERAENGRDMLQNKLVEALAKLEAARKQV